jgi:hypothetical protein
MEEKEMIHRIKNSLKAGRSRAEILSYLQGKGYKLEYADALLKKAKPRRVWLYVLSAVILLIVLIIAAFTYLFFFQGGEKLDLTNPLAGLNINFGSKNTTVSETPEELEEVYIEDIEVTPEFISYLLNEIGATENLHKNPLGFENPIINFKIDDLTFTSEIDSGIETTEGISEEADIQFNTDKEGIVKAILSETPEEIFKESIANGKTEIQKIADDTELFSKGYLQLYGELK